MYDVVCCLPFLSKVYFKLLESLGIPLLVWLTRNPPVVDVFRYFVFLLLCQAVRRGAGRKPVHCKSPLEGSVYSVIPQMLLAPESFSWWEVLEIGSTENHSLVAPACQILLPLRNNVIRIHWVTVWLSVSINRPTFMVFAKTLQSLPPIMQSMVTFPKVVLASYHGV